MMGGDVDHPQALVSQHHGVLIGVGVVGIDLGMAGVVVAGHVDGLLGQGIGDGGIYLAGHGQLNDLFHILEGRLAPQGAGADAEGPGLILAGGVRDLAGGHQAEVQHIDGTIGESGVLHVFHWVQSQADAGDLFGYLQGIVHTAHIAHYQGAAAVIDGPVVQGPDSDLRPISKGVTHRDAENGSIHILRLLLIFGSGV